jgi:hypothetical protein
MKTNSITENQVGNRKAVVSERQLGSDVWFEVDCCELTLGGWWKVSKSKTYTRKATAENLVQRFLS